MANDTFNLNFDQFLTFKKFHVKKSCPLSLHAVLAYSFLCFRDRIGKRPTILEMRSALRMRSTLDNAIGELRKAGLMHSTAIQVREPAEAASEWFIPSTKKTEVKHFADKYMGQVWFTVTEICPYSIQYLAVWFTLLDLDRQGKDVSYAGLAALLNISERTVMRALDEFQNKGIMRKFPGSRTGLHDVCPQPLPQSFKNWFHEKPSDEAAWLRAVREASCTPKQFAMTKRLIDELTQYLPISDGGEFCRETATWSMPAPIVFAELIEKAVNSWDKDIYETWVFLFAHLVKKRILERKRLKYMPDVSVAQSSDEKINAYEQRLREESSVVWRKAMEATVPPSGSILNDSGTI